MEQPGWGPVSAGGGEGRGPPTRSGAQLGEIQVPQPRTGRPRKGTKAVDPVHPSPLTAQASGDLVRGSVVPGPHPCRHDSDTSPNHQPPS